jgi:hypothetical protein
MDRMRLINRPEELSLDQVVFPSPTDSFPLAYAVEALI